jgi:DNA-binding LacI/PurR family transcriptional regulator
MTIEDVAKKAGVSTATVSRVLNGLHRGESSIKRRVLKAVKDLNYRPHGVARRLATGTTASMSFVMESSVPIGTYGGDILQGAEEEARDQGYNLYYSTNYHTLGALAHTLPQEVLDRSIDGMIYVGEIQPELLEWVRKLGTPLVLVNSFVSGVECVMCDNVPSAYRAVKYLIDLGHRRIACIACGSGDVPSIEERVRGYRQALLDAGIPHDEHLFYRQPGFAPPGGYEAMKRFLEIPNPPTAVFGTIDEVAIGAMKYAKEVGLVVPDDLSFVGVNDLDFTQFSDPPLTTVRIFRQEMGQTAVRKLIELIKNPGKPPTRTDVLCEFVERASCAKPPEVRG